MTKEFVWVKSNGEQTILNVEDRIGYTDMVAIIESVVAEVYRNGSYRPYMQEVALYNHMLQMYVGLAFDSVDELMDTIETTNLKEFMSLIDRDQCEKMSQYIQKKLEHEEKKTGMDRLMDYVTVLAKTGAMEKVAEEVAKVMDLNSVTTDDQR